MYFGKISSNGIVPLMNYNEAKAKYEGTAHIRGRDTNERPLGVRKKPQFQIQKRGDSYACVCWKTDVVVYNPDNTIDVHVPAVWRSQTTAKFIGEVLGYGRAGAAVQDNDVVIWLKGTPGRYLRAGENVKFGIGDDGHLTLLANDRNHKIHNINRVELNAARKTIADFRKYMRGNLKLREGVFNVSEQAELSGLLLSAGVIREPLDMANGWRTRTHWTIEMPLANRWYYSTNENGKSFLERARAFLELAQAKDNTKYNALVCWLAFSTVGYFSRETFTAVPSRMEKLLTDLLIVTHPQVLEERDEPANTIQRDAYARFNYFKNAK